MQPAPGTANGHTVGTHKPAAGYASHTPEIAAWVFDGLYSFASSITSNRKRLASGDNNERLQR